MSGDDSERSAARAGENARTGASGDEPKEPDPDARERIEAALREIRREGVKAAALTTVLEATALFLAANLLLTALAPARVPGRYSLPAGATERIESLSGADIGTVAAPGSAAVAAVAALAWFALGVALRAKRPIVEQFEAVNPRVAEELRTARDAAAAEAESRMALRLYEDVLADLRESSGAALVSGTRLTLSLAVIVALSLATVQVAVADLALLDGGGADDGGPVTQTPEPYEGLRDGDEVLGDREAVSAGEDNQTAQVESTGGDRELDEDREFPPPESGGASGGDGSVEGQQAGYAQPEQVEDADLVREYNHRIREEDGDDNG